MALGDIKKTLHYEIVYAPKGTGTLVAGRSVATDANGLWIPSTTSTTGTGGIYSGITHTVDGTIYYGVLVKGYIVIEGGGAVKPNKYVKSDATGKLIVATVGTDNGTQKLIGVYVRLASDDQFNPSDLADTLEGVARIGVAY
jgi:hypothetical protein